MKREIAMILWIMVCICVFSGCVEKKKFDFGETLETSETSGSSEDTSEETSEETKEDMTEDTTGVGDENISVSEPAAAVTEENKEDGSTALLMLGGEEIRIAITDVQIDDSGILSFAIDGIDLGSAWRQLDVFAVVDGERFFLEQCSVSQDGYKRTSLSVYDKLPEQLILFEKENEQDALIYDVAAGRFLDESGGTEGTEGAK